jgi:adenylate kinase family enzyme
MSHTVPDLSLVKTKVAGLTDKFDLADPTERYKYFQAKAGREIEQLKVYLENNSFIAYLLGKKNSGKGTYTKLMMEIFGKDKIGHISVGDVVRAAYADMNDEQKKQELVAYLKNNYRGYISVDEALETLVNKSQDKLLPTEFILTLVKKEIDKLGKLSLFIDGFPRDLDQISYSLYFRDLINYRQDPDIFVTLDVPNAVIDERIKYRVVCPECHTPRNLKLLATKSVGYNEEKKEFYLICDDPVCGGMVMVGKEGDNLGIETIRKRLELDEQLIRKVASLHGIPKIFLRNAIPVAEAENLVDHYEITPEFVFEYDLTNKKVVTKEKPWSIKDNEGIESYSLMSPPVVVSLVKQLAKILC